MVTIKEINHVGSNNSRYPGYRKKDLNLFKPLIWMYKNGPLATMYFDLPAYLILNKSCGLLHLTFGLDFSCCVPLISIQLLTTSQLHAAKISLIIKAWRVWERLIVLIKVRLLHCVGRIQAIVTKIGRSEIVRQDILLIWPCQHQWQRVGPYSIKWGQWLNCDREDHHWISLINFLSPWVWCL